MINCEYLGIVNSFRKTQNNLHIYVEIHKKTVTKKIMTKKQIKTKQNKNVKYYSQNTRNIN